MHGGHIYYIYLIFHNIRMMIDGQELFKILYSYSGIIDLC